MSFNLGLEALAEPQFEVSGDVLSYEFLDTVMRFNDEAAEAVVIADGISSLCGAYENLGAICEVLAQHGNSPALEALVGGNFRDGFSMEAAEKAKESLWARFVKWLKTLWAKIKAAFASFFSSATKMKEAIEKRISELSKSDMAGVSISLPGITTFKTIINFKPKLDSIIQALTSAGDDIQEGKAEEVGKKIQETIQSNVNMGNELLSTFNSAASSEFTKSDAIAMLRCTAELLDLLMKARTAVDAAEKSVEKFSNDLKPANFAKNGEEEKKFSEVKEGADLLNTARTLLMNGHSFVSKFLTSVTRKCLAYASMELSAFKPTEIVKDSKKETK